jgi:thioredoxin-related protein
MKMSKTAYLFLFLACLALAPPITFAQTPAIRFEQLDSMQRSDKRHVVVFLHTSWCRYCSIMENTTFKNKEVLNLLHQNFYFVSLDIETKNDIFFRGYNFKYQPTGINLGVHELAKELGTINGALAYPAICILNDENEIIFQREGYISAKEFLPILKLLNEKTIGRME